jgi:hypothetical protein
VILDSDLAEHGTIQAANVLNSPRAVAMGVYVVRAFVKLRELLITNKELARRLDELEARLDKRLTEHAKAIAAILAAIRELMRPPEPQRRTPGRNAPPHIRTPGGARPANLCQHAQRNTLFRSLRLPINC